MSAYDFRLLMALDAPEHPAALDGPVPFADPGLRRGEELRGQLGSDGADTAVEEQGWGLIVPDNDLGRELLRGLDALVRHRGELQGRPPRVDWLPPGLGGEALADWVRSRFPPGCETDREVPRYVALLGPPDPLPFELEPELVARNLFPGRIPMTDPAALRAYADKVVRAERGVAPPRVPLQLGSVVDRGEERSGAVQHGEDHLIRPLLRLLEREALGLELDPPVALGDTLGDPTALLGAAGGPAVLLTVAHGLASAQLGPAGQRARQGSLSFGKAGVLEAAALAGRPFLPGGLWVSWACCGAGTPGRSAFLRWFEALAEQARRAGDPLAAAALRRPQQALLSAAPADGTPFVAALPMAALATPEGPLGVCAHVDLAFTYSWGAEREEVRPHRNLLVSAARGEPLGYAVARLIRQANEARQEFFMASSWGESAEDRRAVAALRTLDHAATLLLGDPAVRLTRAPEPAPTLGLSQLLGFGFDLDTPAGAAALPTEALERGLGRLLCGEPLAGVAQDLGVSEPELEQTLRRYQQGGRAALGR